jgi:hypothetical protein
MNIDDVLDGRYRLEERLTDTDTGVVYRAKDLHDDLEVAVKLVPPARLTAAATIARYCQDVRVATGLRHANLVSVVRVGETAGVHYTVMDLVVGWSLRSAMGVTMTPRQVVHIVRQLLEGLKQGHEAGLVHGAIGPDTIMLAQNPGGRELPKIAGFGARALRPPLRANQASTALLELEGSSDFAAPEQLRGDEIDCRADLFAVGVLAYALVTGVTPFVDHQAQPMAKRAPWLDVDPLLEAFAMWLMQPSPDKRPASAAEAAHVLDMIARDRRGAATKLGAIDNQMTMRLELIAAPLAPIPVAPVRAPRAASETGDLGYEQLPKRRPTARGAARFSPWALALMLALVSAWQSPVLLRSAALPAPADSPAMETTATALETISRHIAVGLVVETSAKTNRAPELQQLVAQYRALPLQDFLETEDDRVYIVGVLDELGRQARSYEPAIER